MIALRKENYKKHPSYNFSNKKFQYFSVYSYGSRRIKLSDIFTILFKILKY